MRKKGSRRQRLRHTVDLIQKKDPLPDAALLHHLIDRGDDLTPIMEQIAQELGIALVSYSMTHHTRQSALASKSAFLALSLACSLTLPVRISSTL